MLFYRLQLKNSMCNTLCVYSSPRLGCTVISGNIKCFQISISTKLKYILETNKIVPSDLFEEKKPIGDLLNLQHNGDKKEGFVGRGALLQMTPN